MSHARGLAAAFLIAALLPFAARPAAAADAQLRYERSGDLVRAVVVNTSRGPLQVELAAATWQGMQSRPALPVSHVLRPGEVRVLAELWPVAGAHRYELALREVPGDPFAIPEDVAYSLPVDEARWTLGQGFHGGYSHEDEANRYAIDLEVAEGTPVLAARAGLVIAATGGHSEGGTDAARFADRANLVRILHDDGSMALYAHLREGGVFVRPGDRVGLGQVIGEAGSTGFASGPHLHFVVQVNVGMRLVAIPFRMVGPDGFLPLGR